MTQTKKKTNLKTLYNKRLSVQISLSGLSFLVTNPISKEVLFFLYKNVSSSAPEELLAELQDDFSENKDLQDDFDEVNVIYDTNLFSQVPSLLFDKTKASDYLKFNSKIRANDFIAYDSLEENDITTVYIPFVNINNYLFDRFGDFNYYHATSVLLKQILNKEKYFSLPKLFIHLAKNSFHLIALKNGKLELCNNYKYRTPEDFIYYILFTLEQLNLNPDTIDMAVSGFIEEYDEQYKILFNYVRNISFFSYEGNITFKEETISHKHLLIKLV